MQLAAYLCIYRPAPSRLHLKAFGLSSALYYSHHQSHTQLHPEPEPASEWRAAGRPRPAPGRPSCPREVGHPQRSARAARRTAGRPSRRAAGTGSRPGYTSIPKSVFVSHTYNITECVGVLVSPCRPVSGSELTESCLHRPLPPIPRRADPLRAPAERLRADRVLPAPPPPHPPPCRPATSVC